MGLLTWLTGQPEPQQNQEEKNKITPEELAKSRATYDQMNCMSCKHLKHDGVFYCDINAICNYEISEDNRRFKFSKVYENGNDNSYILRQANCGNAVSDLWIPRKISYDGYAICDDCDDVY